MIGRTVHGRSCYLWAGQPGFDCRQCSDRNWGVTSLLPTGTGVLSPDLKRPKLEAEKTTTYLYLTLESTSPHAKRLHGGAELSTGTGLPLTRRRSKRIGSATPPTLYINDELRGRGQGACQIKGKFNPCVMKVYKGCTCKPYQRQYQSRWLLM